MSVPAPLEISVSSSTSSVLTINGGSSSIKFALYAAHNPPQLLMRGRIENIGSAGASFSTHDGIGREISTQVVEARDHHAGVTVLMNWLEQSAQPGMGELIGIGHRIVHGGPLYHAPQRVTSRLLRELQQLAPLDRTHLPLEIRLIEAFQQRFPHLSQVACFDTGFFHHLPHLARLLTIPRRYGLQGLRRYGFHGLSYEFLMGELVRVEGANAAQGRIVLAHLGSGASLAAVHMGKPVDTSMALTPASGVMMGTRSGDIDPGLPCYLARTEGMDAAQFDDMVNTKSGLLGVSETSGDIRELLDREVDDPRAADAVALFCYQIRKCIGSFAAALGGLDMVVFSGGIGENAAIVRSRICEGLEFLGIALNAESNMQSTGVISTDAARVKVHVIRTDEESVIAVATCALLGNAERQVTAN
ncbi:MAG: acetate/propionate family kinase [Betaproteobacteria bacterium]